MIQSGEYDHHEFGESGDFRIDAQGRWYHNGDLIKRDALVKLFAVRALKRDGDGNYWLQTPYEKYPVEVEDAPFLVVDYLALEGCVTFKTNIDEDYALGSENPIFLKNGLPYLKIRDGMEAKIGRGVLYNLIEEFGSSITVEEVSYPLGEMDT